MRSCVCPWCSNSLLGRKLKSQALPGQRRFFPMYAAPVCPDCGGFLRQRGGTHPVDRLAPWLVLPVLLMSAAKSFPEVRSALQIALAAALLGVALATAYLLIKHKRSPIYYERYERSDYPF